MQLSLSLKTAAVRAPHYKAEEQRTKALYVPDYARHYRQYDEKFVHEADYSHYHDRIAAISGSFGRPISVLEIGCGTGRYFHALRNTEELTGMDISAAMLEQARTPLLQEQIHIPRIRLVQGNIYEYDFSGGRFDLILAIGVLGEHAPFTPELCNKLHGLLNHGGKLFVTVVDLESRKRLRRRLAELAYPFLPAAIRQVLDRRWVTNYLTRPQLETLLRESLFGACEISVHRSKGGGWQGQHLECIAQR